MTLTNTTYDILTGETTVRDFTAEETAMYEAEQAKNLAKAQAAQAKAEADATAKAELLKRLGITAEEAALLLS